jgi:hypothetical protein
MRAGKQNIIPYSRVDHLSESALQQRAAEEEKGRSLETFRQKDDR